MNSPTDLQTLLQTLSEPITPQNATAHAARFHSLEAEWRRQLCDEHTPASMLEWLDTLRSAAYSASRLALQWAMARARPVPDDADAAAPDAYIGFCPVTIAMTSRTAPLPSLTPEFFCLPQAQPLITILEGHGLSEDARIAMDAVLYPLPVMARWRASELPLIARTLTPVKNQSLRPQASEPGALRINQDDLMCSLTVAGDRIVGSFLLPVLFHAPTMTRPPAALTGQMADTQLAACAIGLSRTGTLALDGRSGLGIETHIGYPRLLWDALEETVTFHATLATYWTARLAVRKGLNVGTLVYAAGPDGHDLAIGFTVGGAIENNLQVIAGTQDELDRYTQAMTRAARDAGLNRIHHLTNAPDWSRDRGRASHLKPAAGHTLSSPLRKG